MASPLVWQPRLARAVCVVIFLLAWWYLMRRGSLLVQPLPVVSLVGFYLALWTTTATLILSLALLPIATRLARYRLLVRTGILVIFGMACVASAELWQIRGWIRPLYISGPSMVPTLVGTAWKLTCPECRYTYREPIVEQRFTTLCPLCQALIRIPPDGSANPIPAERLLIDARAKKPERWQVWALRDPNQVAIGHIKRVVGLPSERVAIRGGNIWIDGRIARKTLDEFFSCAVLVDDSRYQNPSRLRWQRHVLSDGYEWFVFSGVHGSSSSADNPSGKPTSDENQRALAKAATEKRAETLIPNVEHGLTSFNSVLHDCLWEVELMHNSKWSLAWRVQTGDGAWLVHVASTGHWSIFWNASRVADGRAENIPAHCRWEFAFIDLQLWVQANGRILVRYPVEQNGFPSAPNGNADGSWQASDGLGDSRNPSSFPGEWFALSFPRGSLRVASWRVWRDVYYTPDPQTRLGNQHLEIQLGPHQYYVLGDNPDNSQDSRTLGPFDARLALGHVWLCR